MHRGFDRTRRSDRGLSSRVPRPLTTMALKKDEHLPDTLSLTGRSGTITLTYGRCQSKFSQHRTNLPTHPPKSYDSIDRHDGTMSLLQYHVAARRHVATRHSYATRRRSPPHHRITRYPKPSDGGLPPVGKTHTRAPNVNSTARATTSLQTLSCLYSYSTE